MGYGYRGKPDNDNVDDTIEGAFKTRLHDIDNYDQALLELKRMSNERSKAPSKYQSAYDIAMRELIMDINIMGHEESFPQSTVTQDIENALKGGKYRELVKEQIAEGIVQLRKKKSIKPKPKRKPKKVVKKCKCK
jgi:hypothetical protein